MNRLQKIMNDLIRQLIGEKTADLLTNNKKLTLAIGTLIAGMWLRRRTTTLGTIDNIKSKNIKLQNPSSRSLLPQKVVLIFNHDSTTVGRNLRLHVAERIRSYGIQCKIFESEKHSPYFVCNTNPQSQKEIGSSSSSECILLLESLASILCNLETNKLLYDHFPSSIDKIQKNISKSLLSVLKSHGVLECIIPLHCTSQLKILWLLWKNSWYTIRPTLPKVLYKKISDYFGPNVATYFHWMQFYNQWLLPPAMCGFILWLYCRLKPGRQLHEPAFFSAGVTLWGLCFSRRWNKKYKVMNHIIPSIKKDQSSNIVMKDEKLRINSNINLGKKISSMLITASMLGGAGTLIIASLNLQGYMQKATSWGAIKPLRALCAKGAIFDSEHPIRSLIPTIIHSAMCFGMNIGYCTVAEKLTEWELEENKPCKSYMQQFESSMIIKRFLFEAFDAFSPLFYLVFTREDSSALQSELASVYATDQVRRLLIETILPFLKHFYSSNRSSNKDELEQKRSFRKENSRRSPKRFQRLFSNTILLNKNDTSSLQTQIDMESYENFDDYLEMVIQFGYVVLFSSVFPLASVFSIASNYFEVRSDCFKVMTIFRRPFPMASPFSHSISSISSCVDQQGSDFRSWIPVVQTLSVISIGTNVYLTKNRLKKKFLS